MPRFILFLLFLTAAGPLLAQQSASFRLREFAFNAGGRPDQGTIPVSANYRITLDAIGDSISQVGLTSASFQMGGGFVAPYPPPQEVSGLRFLDHERLVWDPESSTGRYNLYRSLINDLFDLSYGSCNQQQLLDTTTADVDLPPANDGFYYLVTAENLLSEEGIKGFSSTGTPRNNLAPCP